MVNKPLTYVQCFDFLTFDENRTLLEKTLTTKEEFNVAGVIDYSNEYPDWRRAKVSFYNQTLGQLYLVLKTKILEKYSSICEILHLEKIESPDIDIQLTAHNDGDYFKVHADNCSEETSNRELTFVYYFSKRPKPFTGGNLVIHGADKISIEPVNNMIIFFDPRILHEVETVHCAGNLFENSRFTLNGWILNPSPAFK
jgi:SM-20-related protein